MKSRLIFWLAAAVLVLAQLQSYRWPARAVFDGAGGGYYGYLPDYFLAGGPRRADSLPASGQAQHPGQPPAPGQLGRHRLPTGEAAGQYPLGVALGELPWFGGAHLYARWHGDPPTGFSRPYQQAVLLAGLAYALLGLWVLRKLLRRHFADVVVAWALAVIALGTNLLVYATTEAALAPAALFMWQAALLYCTARWYESPRRRWAAGIGLFLGLAVLCRFSEGLYALVPLAWGLGTGRRPALARYPDQVLMAGGTAAAVLSLQLFYWHAVSGHWLPAGYLGADIDFRHPHILLGFFGFRSGWLLYTPLLALALLGVGWLRRSAVPGALAPVLVGLPVLLWAAFSGPESEPGGGFGAQLLISAYPLLALPLAALLAATAARGGAAWVGLRGLLVAGIVLNMWQAWQWHSGVIEPAHETRQLYFERFFWRRLP